jgi:uncharacterized membrane-anchored protein
MKYWHKLVLFLNRIIFKNRSYSVLLNNINGASFEEVKEQLKGMKATILNKTNEGYIAKFTSFHTEYILSFTSCDKVKRIEIEHWKDLDVKFGKEIFTK